MRVKGGEWVCVVVLLRPVDGFAGRGGLSVRDVNLGDLIPVAAGFEGDIGSLDMEHGVKGTQLGYSKFPRTRSAVEKGGGTSPHGDVERVG